MGAALRDNGDAAGSMAVTRAGVHARAGARGTDRPSAAGPAPHTHFGTCERSPSPTLGMVADTEPAADAVATYSTWA